MKRPAFTNDWSQLENMRHVYFFRKNKQKSRNSYNYFFQLNLSFSLMRPQIFEFSQKY